MRRLPFQPGLALSLAFRGLVRDPSSSLLAAVILALGLAAPVTFFSLLMGAIRPLPVDEGDRVVRVDVVRPASSGAPLEVTADDLARLQGVAGLEALGGFQVVSGTIVDPDRAAARFSGAALTPQVLPLLRVQPSLGRLPAPGEEATTLLIGHRLWHELYAGDPGALGRAVEVDGVPRTLVGVLPEGFGFPFKQDAWIVTQPGFAGTVELVGRLADGVTHEAVTAQLQPRWSAGDALREPGLAGGVLMVRPFTGGRGEGGEAVAFVALVLVGLCLLLIACANVANLLLVRATQRVRVLGVQAALGAGRGQIAAQLFTEALLVALAGGAVGLFLASLAIDAIQTGLSEEHFGYFWMRMAVDGPVLLFVGALVVGTALVSGILPVGRVLRTDVQRVLKDDDAGVSVGGGGAWSRAFVTVQLGLSCGALVAAGLTGQAIAGSRDFGKGVPSDEILMAAVDVARIGTGTVVPGRLDALEAELSAVPAVRGAALALGAPGYRERYGRVEVLGREPQAGDPPVVRWNAVSSGFFAAVDLTLLAGRGIEDSDVPGAEPVAVVSEAFARVWSTDAAVLGRSIRLPGADSTALFTVVGVVEDAPLSPGAPTAQDARVYLSVRQVPGSTVSVLLRGQGDVSRLAPELRRAVAAVAPDMAVWDVRTLADGHAYMVRVPRAFSAIAAAGGAAGLLVASVGLYGLLAFRVRQRRRELGVRLALGADGRRLAGEVLGLAARQIVPAMAVGMTVAWLIAPVLGAFLMGLDPRSPRVYAAVAVAFVTIGMLAAVVPAVRAARVDPAAVLRGD